MMKTATITWISHDNCGTYLQAWALQNVIKSLGYENRIIDDRKIVTPNPLLRFLGKMKHLIVDRFDKCHQCFLMFKKNFLEIEYSYNSFAEINEKYDIIICGSDQIWYPRDIIKPYYYADFFHKKKISYAASTGTNKCSHEYADKVKELLKDFSHISVREEEGASMLSRILKKDIDVVLDPTLLIEPTEWDRLIDHSHDLSNCIFCYFLTLNMQYIDYARNYAAQNGKTLLFFDTGIYKATSIVNRNIFKGGPKQFLSCIKMSDLIFTDSYHASIFSVLYHKDFLTFVRFKESDKMNQNTRVYNLFEKIGISNRLVPLDRISFAKIEPIDYQRVDEKIRFHRNHSLNYLSNALAQ